MQYTRERWLTNLVRKFDSFSLGKIGWSLLGLFLLSCILGYLFIIKEVEIIFFGPIPWISIITQEGKSYLSLLMDLANSLFNLLNLDPFFNSKNTNIMIGIGNAAIITLGISVFSFIFGFFLALILAVIMVTPKNVFEYVIGTLLWVLVFSSIFIVIFNSLGEIIIFGPIFLFSVIPGVTIGSIFGLLFGIGVGILTGFRTGLKSITRAYIDFFRSTPLLVQMFIVYFGIPILFTGPEFKRLYSSILWEYVAPILALGLNTAAYQAEIIRSGILAIPIGQTEASRGLGFSTRQTLQYIIIPQALRIIIPPLTNEGINVILNSSLASVISTREITRVAGFLVIATFDPFLIFGIAAIFYFIMAFSLAKLTQNMEKKYRIPGLGVEHD